ncbi:hypothetical protein CCP3SC1AL1_2760007 [Gammaproteobacteria bacterium]
MENYKADYYNPETFEKSEFETKIPVDLVQKIHHDLNCLRGYFVTPSLINPDDKDSVVFGITIFSWLPLYFPVLFSLKIFLFYYKY